MIKDSMKELVQNDCVLQGLPEPPTIIPMRQESTIALLLVSGFIVITGLVTMVVLPFILSGDSTTEKQSSIIPQLIQQNQVM